MAPLQLAAQPPGDVALAGHVAQLGVLLVLAHRRPAHPGGGAGLLRLGAHQARLAVAVPAAQLPDTAAVGEQAGAFDCRGRRWILEKFSST